MAAKVRVWRELSESGLKTEFWFHGFRFKVPSFRFQVPSSRFKVPGLGSRFQV